ncbi:MAG TPA: DUF2934 domain-containing protein [Candidatus Sulfotelmatobacter sp.]|jgi:hypothetical protein|nr:DUF2934 domain-containing protein [Candidatus Sulfotelmatobacter sp.]
MSDLLERKIRLHAQHLYDQRGPAEGNALQDWVEAESRVLENTTLATFYRKTRSEGRSDSNEESENQQFAAANSALTSAGA